MAATETHRAIETVFRIERARLIAGLARMVQDVGLAEELAHDALVIALSEWPQSGVPNQSEIGFVVENSVQLRQRFASVKRPHAREHFVHHGTQRPDIRTLIHRLAARLLG